MKRRDVILIAVAVAVLVAVVVASWGQPKPSVEDYEVTLDEVAR